MTNCQFYKFHLMAVLTTLVLASCGAGIDSQRKQAIAKMQQSVISNPTNMNSVRELGILYYEDADFNKARALLFKVISQNPEDLRARSYLGLSYEALGKDSQAQKLYNASINSESPYKEWLVGRKEIIERKQARTFLRSRVEEIRTSNTELKKRSVVGYISWQKGQV